MAWPAIISAAASIGSAAISANNQPESGTQELPWYIADPTKGYYHSINRNFQDKYDPNVYKGNRSAQMPSWLEQDLNAYRGTVDDPNSNFGLAQQYTRDQVAGDYLGLNPAMQAAVMNPAMDASASRFAKMGRSGMNPANVQSMNSSGMSALMPFHNQALNRQMTAAAALPGFDTEAMNRQQYAGDAFMRQDQNRIDDKMYRHDFRQNEWLNRMQAKQGLLNPATGYAPQQTKGSLQPDYLSAGLGGAMLGSQLYNNYQSPYNSGSEGQGSIMSSSGGYPVDTTGMYDLNYDFGPGGSGGT